MRALELKGEFESLVFPYRENFDPVAMRVHRIPEEDLYRAPTLAAKIGVGSRDGA